MYGLKLRVRVWQAKENRAKNRYHCIILGKDSLKYRLKYLRCLEMFRNRSIFRFIGFRITFSLNNIEIIESFFCLIITDFGTI